MRHIYSNFEGELVAANSLRAAAKHHDCELGGAKQIEDGWSQVDDNHVIAIDCEDAGRTIRHKAKTWARQYDTVTQVATTYR